MSIRYRGSAILKLNRLNLFIIPAFATLSCVAQHNASSIPSGNSLEEILETTAEQSQQESADNNPLLEDLVFYAEHPINLNHSKKEELQALHLLNELQILQLLAHIENNGSLLLIYELQAIEGFDLPTIQKILPYVTVNDDAVIASFNKNNLLKNAEQTVIVRAAQVLEKQTGFTPIDSASLYKKPNSRYIGSPQKIVVSYNYTNGKTISLGVIAEKDPGELFFKQRQKYTYAWYNYALQGKVHTGFDFYSAHLFIHDVKIIKALAIGDYTITFGQGVTTWGGLSLGKSPEILYTKKSAAGIRPSTSADENQFMRGIAATIQLKKTRYTLFYSRKRIDANVSDTLEDGTPALISSLQQTGLHSTPAEIADKHSTTQTTYGGNITYSRKRLNIGFTLIHDHLDLPLQPEPTSYNSFQEGAGQQFNMGMDYQFIWRNFYFFGETARSRNGGFAFLNGLFISLDPRLSFTLLHRNYERNYQNRMSAPFAESGSSNEKGIYMGVSANLTQSLILNVCYDRFKFPWLSYQVDAPSRGNDVHAQFSYSPSKKLTASLSIRQRYKQKNTKEEVPLHYLVSMHSENYRLNIRYMLSYAFKLDNRVEVIRYQLESKTQSGYIIYQDIRYNPPRKPFAISLRYALFQTDGYDSRLYTYENDVPGSYAVPSFYDRGSRFYILLNYTLSKHIELWLRYSQTFYDNKDVISEGTLSEIQGNTKSEIKVQLRFKM